MVNEDNNLFGEHPNWSVKVSERAPNPGKHQLTSDMTNPEVRDYFKKTLTTLFSSANIKYVKWDMNRNFSDTVE